MVVAYQKPFAGFLCIFIIICMYVCFNFKHLYKCEVTGVLDNRLVHRHTGVQVYSGIYLERRYAGALVYYLAHRYAGVRVTSNK